MVIKHQFIPKVQAEDVQRVVRRDFAADQVDEVMAVLSRYDSGEQSRVQLAVLKLSDGNMERLVTYVKEASWDYSDVLVLAEYPHAVSGVDAGRDDDDSTLRAAIYLTDWHQYQAWFQRGEKQTPHSLVAQLRFTRAEFIRAAKGVSDDDARRRSLPMNCLAWNVGHLAWQEQRYFLYYGGEGRLLLPEIDREFAYGAPASEPALTEMVAAWRTITAAADPWLDTFTSPMLAGAVISQGKPLATTHGNLLQRVIYHYWYHTGENMAIRQLLGHTRLPVYVGDIDNKAPYRPEEQ